MTRRNLPSRGIAAGLTGTVFLVLLLLVIDAVSSSPTSQLGFLSQIWFGTTSLIAALASLLIVFVILVAISWGLQLMDDAPPFLFGGAAGLVLFSLIFYASVVLTGTNVINEVSWRVFLPGALLAGFAAVAYLRVTAGAPMVGLTGALREHRVLREGLITGILGGAAVALWFLAIDLVAGRPFFTPAALGAAFIQGHSSLAAVEISFVTIAGYTLLHFGIFILIGLLAARVSADAERDPPLILALVLMFVVLEVTSLGVIAAMAAWLFESIPWWNFLVANLIAAGVMGIYLWRKHAVLQQHVRSNVEEALAHTR